MNRLIIVPTTDQRLQLVETPIPIELTHTIFTSRDDVDLEKYGQTWARFWKTDIVMLMED